MCIFEQGLSDKTSGHLGGSERTRKDNHLQLSLQRQHPLLDYFKSLSIFYLWFEPTPITKSSQGFSCSAKLRELIYILCLKCLRYLIQLREYNEPFFFNETLFSLLREWRTHFKDLYNYFDFLGLVLTILVIPLRFVKVNSQWSVAGLGYLFNFLKLFKFSGLSRYLLWGGT